mgnify:CR=1 FL=1
MATFYEEVGGEPFFNDFVSQFYGRAATNPILRPMYPEKDMQGAALRLKMFLEQYWGGPSTYQENRGHPRLRMRHAEFPITQAARDAWLNAMHQAVNGVEMDAALKAELWIYLEMAANSLVNQPD